MRVCIVTTAFPRWKQDDRGSFILEAARALQTLGAQVRVIAMHSPHAKTKEMMDSIEVIRPRYLWPERLEILQKEGGGLPVMWRKSRLARLALLPFFVAHTLAIMRHAWDCDIIHANWTLSAAAAWAGQFYHRRPFILTVQGSDIFQAIHIPLVRSVTKIALRRCARILALSRSLAEATMAMGFSADCIEIVPNGVDTDMFRPPSRDREPLILFVGSLIERKGVKYLIQAMPQVLRKFPEHRLAIIGEGPLRSELAGLIASLGVVNNISFVGTQTPGQIVQWMQRAGLLVLPSLEEGLGVVLLEALASGTPCVGSRVGGIQDIISPDVGMLVPPADPPALSSAILALLEVETVWKTMSQNARARAVERYSWRMIASHLIEIYHTIVNATELP